MDSSSPKEGCTSTECGSPSGTKEAFIADWPGSTLIASSADYYFNSYNHYGVHEDVLKDVVTTSAYQRAVKQNAHLFRGKVVLDVCAGLGVCSLLAAQAGAKKVLALESQEELMMLGETVARHNGFGKEQLEFVRGDAFTLESLPGGIESVDIIISEWMGFCLLYEARLGDVLRARDRWLRPGGLMFPDRARLHCALLEDAQYKNNHFNYYKDVWGFNYQAMQAPAHSEPVVQAFEPNQLVSTPTCVLNVDLRSCTSEQCFQLKAASEVHCKRDGKAHALLFWFDVSFAACHKPIEFDTHPESQQTCWKQTAFFLEGPALTVKRNEKVRVMVAFRKNDPDKRHLDVKVLCKPREGKLLSSPKVAQVLQDHPELNENPTALLDHLEGQGLIENIFASLESVLQQQQRWPAAPAVSLEGAAPPVQARPEPHTTATAAAYPAYGVGCETSGGSSSSTAPSPLWHLGLRLVEGRSFLDYLDEADSAGRELQWHVSFGGQRFRSRVVPSAVDPYFDATFSLALPQVRSRAALLTHAAPMHLVLVCRGGPGCREDPWDAGEGTQRQIGSFEVTLLCSHYLEWRNCLAAVGPYKLTIELRGVGRRKQLSVGVLHAEVELRGAGAASTSALLTEQAVGTQIRGEEQRRANVMRRVFEDLDRWWAQYHELFASRYVCLFAQTESCLFLPVTSFVTPLEAGRSLDSPGHALRWVSLMGTDPRPALESAEPRWHTIPALWAQGRGTVEEKTLMLCSLLLGFSLDAWCCLGTDTRGQPHAWVIVRSKGDASKPADVMCWDVRAAAKIACNSAQFLAAYSSVDAAFNHRRMLVCHADSAARVSFDFGDPKVWLGVPLDGQDVDALRLYPALSCPPFADLRPQIWNPPFQACDIEEAIEQRLENALKAHREAVGLQTTFDRHLAQLLHIALVNCEHERAGIASADASLFEEIVKGVCAQGEVFRAVPVQFNHLKLSLFWPTLSDRQAVREALALSAGPPLFALRARVVVFPEGAVAAWVLLAVRCRSS